jgi:hypothetical protein
VVVGEEACLTWEIKKNYRILSGGEVEGKPGLDQHKACFKWWTSSVEWWGEPSLSDGKGR